VDGVVQHAPAPRFDRSVTATPLAPPLPGENSRRILQEAGYSAADIDALLATGAIVQA